MAATCAFRYYDVVLIPAIILRIPVGQNPFVFSVLKGDRTRVAAVTLTCLNYND